MRKLFASLFVLLALASSASAQALTLSLKGDGIVVVKVDRIIVVKDDLTVVQSFPFTVNAPTGMALYFWQFPAGVVAVDKGEQLEVQSAPKGPLTISVKAITADFDKKLFVTKIGNVTFSIGDVPPPVPPTPPVPPVPPTPPVPPAPIPDAGFRAMVVYETADLGMMPASQAAILTSAEIQAYMNQKAAKGPDGKTAEFRKYDKDVDITKESAAMQKLFQRPRTSLPWIVISNGVSGYEGPLPANIADTLTLLKKFGG